MLKPPRRQFLQTSALLAWQLAQGAEAGAHSPPELLVAAYPSVDAIAKAAIPAFQKLYPEVKVNVVARQIGDHHTAMMTALSTASYLPDVMAIEVGYLGRFARGGGLLDLTQAPWNARVDSHQLAPFAVTQASPNGQSMFAIPSDIGPGTLIYRNDLLKEAGFDARVFEGRWEDLVNTGIALKSKTGAYLVLSLIHI